MTASIGFGRVSSTITDCTVCTVRHRSSLSGVLTRPSFLRAARAGEKLRKQGVAASTVCVFPLTDWYRPDLPQYHPQAGRELLVPTCFTPELVGECQRVLEAIYRPGHRYTKAGVHFLDLVPDDEKQASLFRPVDPAREKKERALMAAVDKLNLWGGSGTVRTAAAGFRQKWQMRRDRMSPCYTTRLADVPCVSL